MQCISPDKLLSLRDIRTPDNRQASRSTAARELLTTAPHRARRRAGADPQEPTEKAAGFQITIFFLKALDIDQVSTHPVRSCSFPRRPRTREEAQSDGKLQTGPSPAKL